MTDDALVALKKRVADGKQWIEKIKAEGKYWTPPTRRHIELWFSLVDQLIEEENRRAAAQPTQGHSKAWMDMLEREAKDEARREKARIAARERAERKRKGIK